MIIYFLYRVNNENKFRTCYYLKKYIKEATSYLQKKNSLSCNIWFLENY